MDDQQARDALASIAAAQSQLAKTQTFPLWRHAALGVVSALLIAAIAAPQSYFALFYIPSMAGIVWLVRYDRRTTGTFVNGWRWGRTLPVSLVLLALLLGLVFFAHRTRADGAFSSEGLLAIAAGFVLGTVFSMVWQRVYIEELRQGGGQ